MEGIAFILQETSPEVLLPALDPTYREKYSYTAEQHQRYDWKKMCFEKMLAIRFKYRKQKTEDGAHSKISKT